MVATAEIVMFAIQAGVRLYVAGRRSYVEATLDRPLILPLPRGGSVDADAAANFFLHDPRGTTIAARDGAERLKALSERVKDGATNQDEEQELAQVYLAYVRELNLLPGEEPGGPEGATGDELVAIMTIRQWSKTERDQLPSALQRIAGTLVNIAVDYFAHTPGAVSENRPAGRALKHFLEAIDDLDFAETPPADIAGELLVAVVDSVAANPDLAGSGDTGKQLVRNISQTLARSARRHLEDVPSEQRWAGTVWLQMIARAVVKGGADTVLADPVAILGVGDDEGKFIQEVGGTVAELLIGSDQDTRLRFGRLLSGEGVNTVIKSALSATAKNPGILRIGNQGLRNIIVGVADQLPQQDNLLTSDIFPDLARLVLDRTAENLELLWPEGASDPARHLLITGTRQLFQVLAEESADGGWPTLTKEQILGVAEVVFDEVVENPEWLLERVDLDDGSGLDIALRATLQALRDHAGPRLSADAAAAALVAAVDASASRLELLRVLPAGGADAGKVAINAAVGAVLDSAFGDGVSAEQKWLRARSASLAVVLEVALDKLAKVGAGQPQIDVLRDGVGGLIDERLEIEEFGRRLEAALAA